jgi:hypothetical protein
VLAVEEVVRLSPVVVGVVEQPQKIFSLEPMESLLSQ